MINVDKLQVNLQYIQDHPEEWYQGAWGRQVEGCGTAFCLAGHAVVREGHALRWESVPSYDHRTGKTTEVWFANETVDGDDIATLAKDILGLEGDGYPQSPCTCDEYDDECYCFEDDGEGHYLFTPERKLSEMWAWAEQESAGAIKPPQVA